MKKSFGSIEDALKQLEKDRLDGKLPYLFRLKKGE